MEFLKAHESITQLKANLREEHVLVQDFLHTLLKHVGGCVERGGYWDSCVWGVV